MRKFFSCCLVGLFVIALSLVMGIFAVKRTILSSSFHKTNLRKTNFYEQSLKKFPPFIAQVLSKSNQSSSDTKTAKQTSEDAQSVLLITTFAKAIEGSVTPTWLQTQTEAIIDSVFGYVQNKSTAINIIIPMAPIKAGLGTSLSATLKEEFNKLPTCTAAQLKQTSQSAGTQCKPAGFNTAEFDKALSDPKTNPFSSIPDQYDLGQQLTKNSQALNTLRTFFRVVNITFWLSVVAMLLAAGIIFLLNLKTIGNALKVIGIPIIVVAGLNLVTTTLSYFSTGFIGTQIKTAGGFSGDLLVLISDVITNNIKAILNLSLVTSIIMLVIGIVMVIIAKKISPHTAPQAKTTPAPAPPPQPKP